MAKSLMTASTVYVVQQQYEKAEPYLVRAVHIDEALYGVRQHWNERSSFSALWTLRPLGTTGEIRRLQSAPADCP